jgi:hypothetical protein
MIRKVIGISAALVLLAVAVALVPQRGKAEDTERVLVVNGPKKPVPVSGSVGVSGSVNANVTNTPKVNVTNTPNVNVSALPAVQLAPGTNVGINGTPNVNVANTPTVKLAPGTNVGITGGLSIAPGTVLNVQNAVAVQPVGLGAVFTIHDGTSGSQLVDLLTVPDGKRFVLEDYSGHANLPIGQGLTLVPVHLGLGNEVDVTPAFTGTSAGGGDEFSWGRTARAYAEAGTTVSVGAQRSGTANDASVTVFISGYLVDL